MARRPLKDRPKQTAKKPSNAVGKAYAKTAPRSAGNSSKKQPAAAEEPQFRTNEQMLSVRLPAELLERLAKLAERRRDVRRVPYTKTAIVAEALRKYLSKAR